MNSELLEQAGMPPLHRALALAVVAVWGTNFVVIHEGLSEIPPLLFAALRFTLAAFPAILFLPRPAAPVWRLVSYGLLIGVGQFGTLFIAMSGHISPGLASLVIQIQVFFTIGLSVWLTGEQVRVRQVGALLFAVLGIFLIGVNSDGSATWVGVGLVVVAAGAWGAANIIARTPPGLNMLSYMVWMSLAAAPALWILSGLLEGPDAILLALRGAGAWAWAAVAWQSVGNTLFGYAAWAWLLARHPAAEITPMALLVPVFGLGASALFLGEPLQPWKLFAAGMVLSGLALGTGLGGQRRLPISR